MEGAPEKVVFGRGDTVYDSDEKLPDGHYHEQDLSTLQRLFPTPSSEGFGQ